jgi:hypothetical protein
MFFFEKKNQKTFLSWAIGFGDCTPPDQANESFCFFFQKEVFPS